MKGKLSKIDSNVSNSKENSILGKLFHRILMELNLINKIEFLINRYIKNANDKDIKIQKRKTRSSLINNITANEITWKTFIDLTFNLLRVRKLKVMITLTHTEDMIKKFKLKNVDDKNESLHILLIEKTDRLYMEKENSILGALLKECLTDLGLNKQTKELVENHLEIISKNTNLKSKPRSSLNSSLIAKEITWKTYMDLTFNILLVRKIRLTVEILNANRTISVHTVSAMKDDENEK